MMLVLLLVLVIVLVPASVAEAYLDPGTGSYLTQWLVAAVVGSIVAIRAYWGRLSHWFSRRRSSGAETRSEVASGSGVDKSASHD